MHTSLEVHLFEQLHLLQAEIDVGVASLASLQTSWDVKMEHQQAVQAALQTQAAQALQEATHKGQELANERQKAFALRTDYSNQHAALVAAQGDLLSEQQRSKQSIEKLQGSLHSLADYAK